MTTIGAFEAKTHLSALLERVARGEEVVITKHGRPVARLVPAVDAKQEKLQEIIERMKESAKGQRLRGLSVRKLREAGRR